MNKLYFFIITLALMITSCDVINPDEPVPSYIYVESIGLTTSNGEGTNSSNIKDVWLSDDSEIIGVFELPAWIPILEEGNIELRAGAGIYDNGIASTRSEYPFYENNSFSIDLTATETDTINLTTTYRDNTNFVFIEDFEVSNEFGIDIDNNSETNMQTSFTTVFEGDRSGLLIVNEDNPTIQVASSNYPLPNNGQQVYLELNYKNDVPLEIGILGSNTSGSTVLYPFGLNTSQDWNKVYINLTEPIRSLNSTSFNVAFKVDKPSSTNEGRVYIDNVKLVHFN